MRITTPEQGEVVIETERLLLRRFHPDDLQELHDYMRLPEVCRWIPFEPDDLAATKVRLERKLSPWWEGDDLRGLSLAVVRREDERLIGDVIFMSSTDPIHQQAEFGYVFNPEVAGRGYATEAVRALLTWGFPTLHLHRAMARVDVENEASWRLLERLGLRREAHLRGNEWFKGRWGDEFDYAVLEDEWPELAGASSSPSAG